MAIRKATTAPKGPSRDQRATIIQRYLKDDQNVHWAREMVTFAALWKAYPSIAFWTRHELPFRLNHMTWFQSVEGAAQLESDWTVFHYVPSAPQEDVGQSTQTLDTPHEPTYHVPHRRPRTVAEFLKTP